MGKYYFLVGTDSLMESARGIRPSSCRIRLYSAWFEGSSSRNLGLLLALHCLMMDLYTDIKTGETKNLLRLLYPNGLCIE